MKSGKPQQQQPPPPPPRQQGTSAARPQFVHRDPSDDLPEGVAPSLVRLHARLQGAERQAVRARTPNLKALFQRRRLSPELDSMWKAQQRVPKESRVVWDPESDDPVVAALQEHARYQPWEVPNSDPVRNTNAMLRSLGYNPSPDDAFRILVALGHFPGKKVNPQLFRAPVKSLTKDEGARITEEILGTPDLDAPLREDLTHLRAYAIDDAATTEVDDAISIEGNRIYVHIADPTAYMKPEGHADTIISQRLTTFYFPETRIHMLPAAVHPPISLGVEPRNALTVSFEMTDDGAVKENSYRIFPSTMKCRLLSYQDVDDMVAQQEAEHTGGATTTVAVDDDDTHRDLTSLHRLMKGRLAHRRELGAVSIQLPEVTPVLDDDGNCVALTSHEPEASRSMIEELMVLAGEVVGRFIQDTEEKMGSPIPMLWRVQPMPRPVLPEHEDVPHDAPAIVHDMALLARMMAASYTTEASQHHALSISCYTQVTSPMRRYNDLLDHFQLKSILHEGIDRQLVPHDVVVDVATRANLMHSSRKQVQKGSDRFWKLRYVEGLPVEKRRFAAIVLSPVVRRFADESIMENLISVWIPELALREKVRSFSPPPMAAEIEVQVDVVNPFKSLLLLSVPGEGRPGLPRRNRR
eukprot:TRINITY_DN5231_c0_g1_i4.p1 TRINITY_DN5231_c0_g1~~TRINITY_DN5231_c0_g1_i4.p1  ORF type:complete len:638 (-),score=125.36 TRINITY_DN5231_c0_g1_i4:12-1925(-)